MMQPSAPLPPNQEPRRAGIEDRAQNRYRCRKNSILRLAVRPSFENFTALVHDISATGIGFLLNRPLEPGTTVALQLQGGRQGCSMIRTAKVVHVRRHFPVAEAPWVKRKPFLQVVLSFLGGGEQKEPREEYIWLIGCRFTPPLSPEEIASLTDGQEA